MKRYISAATKLNKSELRSQFVDLATRIRDMSKNEFVAILKNNDFDTALDWIDSLQDLYDRFEQSAHSAISYYYVKVTVDGKFVGYVSNVRLKSGSRGWRGRANIDVSYDIDNAITFPTIKDAKAKLNADGGDIGIYLEDGTGYRREWPDSQDPNMAGVLNELASHVNNMDIYFAHKVEYEFIQA